MKPKTMILMVVAVVCGLGASYMTSKLLAERNNQQQEEEQVTVLVAKQKVPQWTQLKEPQKLFEEKIVPKSQAGMKAIGRLEDLKDKRVSVAVKTGDQISTDEVVSAADGLAMMIPPGHRAYSISVNAATAASGFILPNSRVDVVSTVSRGEQSFAQTILQNVLVLAVNQTAVVDGQTTAMMANTVTVAVTPDDVQALSLAGSQSELKLSLRPIGESEIVNNKKTTVNDVGKKSPVYGLPGTEGTKPSGIFTVPTLPETKPEDVAKSEPKKVEEPKAEEPKKERSEARSVPRDDDHQRQGEPGEGPVLQERGRRSVHRQPAGSEGAEGAEDAGEAARDQGQRPAQPGAG